MPTYSETKAYADTALLTEAILDNTRNAVTTLLNTTKLDNDNIQAEGITTECLASNSVDTAAIDNLAVTTAKLADEAVTTAKIAANQVTKAKLATPNIVYGTMVNSTTIAARAYTIEITTTGRPVLIIALDAAGSTSNSGNFGGSVELRMTVVRTTGGVPTNLARVALTNVGGQLPLSFARYIDTPSAGTHTYTGTLSNVRTAQIVAWELS